MILTIYVIMIVDFNFYFTIIAYDYKKIEIKTYC